MSNDLSPSDLSPLSPQEVPPSQETSKGRPKGMQRNEEQRVEVNANAESSSRRVSMKDRWKSVVESAQTNNASRVHSRRRESLRYFEQDDLIGLVSQRVKMFEDLCMQKAASKEKMEATIMAVNKNKSNRTRIVAEVAKDVSKRPPDARWSAGVEAPKPVNVVKPSSIKKGRDESPVDAITSVIVKDSNDESGEGGSSTTDAGTGSSASLPPPPESPPISLFCGETITMALSSDQSERALNLLRANSMRPVALPTGLSSSESFSTNDVVAVAMFDNELNEAYLAITIDFTEGKLWDETAYGLKKVIVFDPNSSNELNNMDPLLSRVFMVSKPENDSRASTLTESASSDPSALPTTTTTEIVTSSSDKDAASPTVDEVTPTERNSVERTDEDMPGLSIAKAGAMDADQPINHNSGIVVAQNQSSDVHPVDKVVDTLGVSSVYSDDPAPPESATAEALLEVEVPSSSDTNAALLSANEVPAVERKSAHAFHEDPPGGVVESPSDAKAENRDASPAITDNFESAVTQKQSLHPVDEAMDMSNKNASNIDDEEPRASDVTEESVAEEAEVEFPATDEPEVVNAVREADSIVTEAKSEAVSAAEGEQRAAMEKTKDVPVVLRSTNSPKIDSLGEFVMLRAGGTDVPEIRPPVFTKSDIRMSESNFDPLVQPTVQLMNISVDLDGVASISGSQNCVLLQLRNPNSDPNQARDTELTDTIAVSSSMKEARSTGTMMLGAPINSDLPRDSLFCWHRGGAFSGWGFKTPMKSQKAGRSTRRFFVYRDDTLSYFRKEPQTLEDVKEIAERRCLKVTKGSTLRVVKKYLRDYVMLETPVDTMWLRPVDRELQAEWTGQIQRTLALQDKKPFLPHLDQISTTWLHERSECCCIAVDGQVRESGAISRVTLFRIRKGTEAAPRKRPWFALGRANDTDPKVSEVKTTYAINFYRSVDSFTVTQVISDLPENVELQCVNVVGDSVALGGTRGFVGFCTQARFRTEQLVPPQLVLDNRQGLVHGTDSTITCIKHCPMKGIIACADDKGGVSIWLLSNPANVFLDAIRPSVFGCSVTSIVFPPSRNYIIVGTSRGLYIVTYDPTKESGAWVTGLAPMRVGELHESMRTAAGAADDGSTAVSKVLSMVCYPRGSTLRGSTLTRETEGSVVIWQLIQKPATGGRTSSQALLVRASTSVAWLDAHCDGTSPIVDAEA